MKKSLSGLFLIMAAQFINWNVPAQGTFQNLDFEQAMIPSGTQPTDSVSGNDAFPGWTGSTGVIYDGFSLGGAFISINDTNTYPGFVVPQGKYCAYLFGGRGNNSNIAVTLSQIGLVPAGTASLRIDASWSLVPFVVTLGGQTINMVPLSSTSTYTVYGGDISAFAGQVAQLSFTEPAPPGADPSSFLLDNIVFSVNSVPEPATCALLLCGVAAFGANRWRKQHPDSKRKTVS